MSAWVARLLWRGRFVSAAFILLGALAMLPLVNFTNLDNDISAWISKSDPAYVTYERFRKEFGGGRVLLVALKSQELFTVESLTAIQQMTDEIQRLRLVERVDSLATANIVRATPGVGEESSGLDVQPLVRGLDSPTSAATVRRLALDDDLLRGDLVSEDGHTTAIVITFDEDRIDDERGEVINAIHQVVDPKLPKGMRAYYNGSLEISETYNRVTIANAKNFALPILALMSLGIFVMFRSWKLTGLVVLAVTVSAGWAMGLFVLLGFKYNVLASMLPPLVLVLAVADDVHIVQHFTHELRDNGDTRQAFESTIRHLFVPLLGASVTTALGLFSLATSNVLAVRQFGIGAGVGVMVDFVLSIAFLPTLLILLKPNTVPPPQERWLAGSMGAVALFAMRRARVVLATLAVAAAVAIAGIWHLRVDTNHINFFDESHPLHQSAEVIDKELSGVYSFNVLFEGEPGVMKTPDTMRRLETLSAELQQLPYVKKVTSVSDYVKRVNRALNGGGRDQAVVPVSAEAIAQELFVFELSGAGRTELERMVASDYSTGQMSVKLASMSSDLVFDQINEADATAARIFRGSGIATTATGSGRIFSTLDHYLVTSQVSSFLAAFVTVFVVIAIIFRSKRFGVLGIIANAVPVLAVLGLMGWIGISLNVATVMVASVALGITDDDTIHFIGRYRRDVLGGMSTADAIWTAAAHEGRASLTTAIINSAAFSVMLLSDYKPSAWFGGLMALTMAMAFVAEIFIVPAVMTLFPRIYGADAIRQRLLPKAA